MKDLKKENLKRQLQVKYSEKDSDREKKPIPSNVF